MNLLNAGVILAMGQPPPGTQADPRGETLKLFGTLALMAVVMYLLIFRPQSKKAKEHAEMLKTVRPGDKIITSGGIVGVIISVKDKTLSIRSADSKFEVTKAAITEISERGGESSSS
jgi:preprotein translocase subunit YajC